MDNFRKEPESFDLIVTDHTMSGMTGIDLALQVHRLKPQTHVILCTGYSSDIDPELAAAAGIEEILAKPISVYKLEEIAARVISGRQKA